MEKIHKRKFYKNNLIGKKFRMDTKKNVPKV